MYQILKEYSTHGKTQKVLMIDSHCEILEFDTIEEANEFCNILNANAVDSKYTVNENGLKNDSH